MSALQPCCRSRRLRPLPLAIPHHNPPPHSTSVFTGVLLLIEKAAPPVAHSLEDAVGAIVQGKCSAGLAEWCGFSVALHGASATMSDMADATIRAAGTEGLVEVMERWLRPIPTTGQT
jgi:hypothetical protein